MTSRRSLRTDGLLSLKHRSLGLAILLLLLGVTIIAARPVFAKPVTFTTVVDVPYSVCVVQLGVENSDGTTQWQPGYAYPGTPISECQDKSGVLGQDVLGRTIMFHQFILGSQDVTAEAGTTVTGTSTTALATSTTTLATSTTALATPEATQNSALAILIMAILAVAVLTKRAKPSGG
jgi:hypothetical protein